MNSNPLIDSRTWKDIDLMALELAKEYVPEWVPEEDDPARALIYLFSRLMEIVIDRLNRVPDKNFLAFLNVAGIAPLPPRSARAPVKFSLSKGAKDDAFVSQGTPLAAIPPDGGAPVNFETEKALTVTRSELKKIYTLNPADDSYSHYDTVVIANEKNNSLEFQPFVGNTPIPHELRIAHNILFNINHPTAIILTFYVDNAALYGDFFKNSLVWNIWKSGEIREITPPSDAISITSNTVTIAFEKEKVSKIDPKLLAPDETSETYWLWASPKDTLSAYQYTDIPLDIPSLTIHSISITSTANNILPELAFFNSTPLDITRDFYPFGEKPKLLDTFFLAVPEAFIRKDSTITIVPDFSPGTPDYGAVLQWDYWKGEKWETLGVTTVKGVLTRQGEYEFRDYTRAFTENGVIRNDRGDERQPTLRVTPLEDSVSIDIANATDDPDNKFQLTVKYDSVPPEYEYFNELTMENVENEINGISKYIRVKNLGSPTPPPGNRPESSAAAIAAPFHRIQFKCPGIEKTEVNGKENYWIRIRIVNGSYGEDAKLELLPNSTEPFLDKWKYSDPTFVPPIFSSLDISYEYLVPPGSNNFTSSYTYNAFEYTKVKKDESFQPFYPAAQTHPSFYLGFDKQFSNRAVSIFIGIIEGVLDEEPAIVWEYCDGKNWKNLGIKDETKNLTESGIIEFIGPLDFKEKEMFGQRLFWIRGQLEKGNQSNFVLNAVYLNTTWVKNCITIKNETLGSSSETPGALFKLSSSPVLEGQIIEVREPERPSEEELVILIKEEGADAIIPVKDETGKSSEYWVRWHEVDNFRLSEKKSRHYIIDRTNGAIIFGDGIRGMIPAAGRDNIRATFYQAGGGQRGNVDKGAITVMKRAVPFIDKVISVDKAGGGSDAEAFERIKTRGPQAIKHRERAITVEDYELLAKESSLQVARAKCLSSKKAQGAGKVLLIIVPWSEEPRPLPSQGLIRQVKEYLYTKRILTADLTIEGPKYVSVSVNAKIFPKKPEEADFVRRLVKEKLEIYLHPLKGGPEARGWEFGRDVYVSEICKIIEDINEVNHAEDVTLSSGEDTNVDHIEVEENYLVSSGEHQLTITGESEAIVSRGIITHTGTASTNFPYLGNTNSKELHDLHNIKTNCRINLITPEHIKYFSSISEAMQEGYDYCAWCFGREMSTR